MNLDKYLIPKINKTKDQYYIKNNNKIIASINFYDYEIDNFDWILIANVETDAMYRNRGFATLLISTLYNDIKYKKGLYLFVKPNNINAINLYKKMGFELLKRYKIKNEMYNIMIKGDVDKNQFDNMVFNN